MTDLKVSEVIENVEAEITRLHEVLDTLKSAVSISGGLTVSTRPGSATEITLNILKASIKPMHGRDLYQKVLEAGANITEASLETSLGRHKCIQRTAPNTWMYVREDKKDETVEDPDNLKDLREVWEDRYGYEEDPLVTWDDFKATYFECSLCGDWVNEPCLCYTRR